MHPNTLLQDLALVMLVAGVVTILFHRLRLSVVLGYMLAGLIVGKHTAIPLLVHNEATVHVLSELGVILLMFSLGLHFSLRKLAHVGASAVVASTIETALMFATGYGLGRLFGWGNIPAVYLGAVLSISSTTITVKALSELKLTKDKFAQVVFGILIVEDVLAIAMLAVLSGLQATDSVQVRQLLDTLWQLSAFLAAVLVIGLLVVPRLLRYINRFKSDEMMLVVSLGLCFGVSFVAFKLGYSVALGSFLIGAVVAEARERGRIETLVSPVRDMFTAIFFVAVGMQIDPAALWLYRWPILAASAVVVFGKTVYCALGTFLGGHDARTAIKVGMSLSQIGEFSFIIASLGLAIGKADPALYPLAVAVSAVTALLTSFKIRLADPLANWLGQHSPRPAAAFANWYGGWMERRQAAGKQNAMVRRLVRKWIFQVVLNGLLAGGVLIAAAAARTVRERWPDLLPSLGGPNAAVWALAMIIVLPLLVVTHRKVRAIAIVIGEAAAKGATPAEAAAVKGTIASTIHAASMVAVYVVLGALSWAILPPWPVLVVLAAGLVLVLATAWRSFERVYNKAQVALKETFEASARVAAAEEAHGGDAPPAPAPPQPIHALLRDAVLESIEVSAGSSAEGKLIRELALRTQTGASAVGIDRAAGAVINPGPDEELQAGDRLLLLGTRPQLEAAKALLAKAARPVQRFEPAMAPS